MHKLSSFMWLVIAVLFLALNVSAQTTGSLQSQPSIGAVTKQTVASSLASLPEADTLIFINPRRILNDAAPKIMSPADFTSMRSGFEDLKKGAGIDPAQLDFVVIAMRFHKPAADLSFVPPEVIAIASGDFSADSLMTLARLTLQEKARDEQHGTRTIAITKIDPVAEAAEKTPMFKAFAEVGFAPINSNTIAIGSIDYLKAALDAADGTGRIANTAIASLIRDPDALISAVGSPISAFAKSFGLLGTQTTPRDSRCETGFGNFYAAITMDQNAFNLRGAMNADNPDTARIINSLFSSLMQQAVSSVPDKAAQNILSGLKMVAAENEVVLSATIPGSAVADLLKQAPKATAVSSAPPTTKKAPVRKKRRPVRRK